MKPTRIITVCLMSLLCGVAWLTLAEPPKLPRKPAATETKGATLLMRSKAAVVVPPVPKETALRLPTNRCYWMVLSSTNLKDWRFREWNNDNHTLTIQRGEYLLVEGIPWQRYLAMRQP